MFRLWEGGGTGQRSYLPGPAMRGACKPGTLQPASALQTLGGGGRRGQEQSERSPRTPAASPTSYERGQSVRQTPSMGSQNKCRSENVFFDLASSTLKTIWILDFTPKHVCVHMCACMCVSPLSFE